MERPTLEYAGELPWGKYKLVFGFVTHRPVGFRDTDGKVYQLKSEEEIVLIGEEGNPDSNDIKIRILDQKTGFLKDVSIEEWLN